MGRGRSKKSGGNGGEYYWRVAHPDQKEQTDEDYEYIKKTADGRVEYTYNLASKDGKTIPVKVSIQNTVPLDELREDNPTVEYKTPKGGDIYEMLAKNAVANTKNEERFIEEPSVAAGKWAKVASVPVRRSIGNGQQQRLDWTNRNGYATGFDGDVIYLQKVNGGWQYNYKGLLASQVYKTLDTAKAGYGETTARLNKQTRESAKKAFDIINANLGVISSQVLKRIKL